MANTNRIEDLANATAYDVDGDKIGGVKDVYVNDTSGQPDFVSVNHGLFGAGTSIVPLRGHTLRDGELHLAFPKGRIEDAPDLDENGHLTTEDQDAFYRHYGLTDTKDVTTYDTGRHAAAGTGAAAGAAGVAGAGAAAGEREVTTDETARANAAAGTRENVADTDKDAIIRSEEQLNVQKDRVESGQVRLRKYVVNETETVEVPVEREEVRVERTPISEADAANFNGTIGDNDTAEASVTLHEERVNVDKKTVPVEKVNLSKETIQDTETHTEELRKEQIDTDGITDTRK